MQCEYMCSNMSSDRNTKKKKREILEKDRCRVCVQQWEDTESDVAKIQGKAAQFGSTFKALEFLVFFSWKKRCQMFAIFLNPHRNNSFTNIFTIICANLQICIWEQTSRTHCVSSVSFFAPWLITRRRFPGAKRMGVNLLSQSESTLGHITLSAEANPRPSASDQWLWHPPFWHSELPRGSLFWSEYRAETSY